MNLNLKLVCEVCDNPVALKVYGGYEKINTFSYTCPECGITIHGHLTWNDPEKLKDSFIKEFECYNATSVTPIGGESHLLQIATEFYSDKIKKLETNDPSIFFSPFMMERIPFELKQKKLALIQHVTDNFKNEYKISTRLWQLFRNKNFKYLNRQLIANKFVEPVILGQTLNIKYSSIMLDVLYYPFTLFIQVSEFNKKIFDLRNQLLDIQRKNKNELLNLKKELEVLINCAEEELIHLLNNFSKYYKFIWPVILSTALKTENIQNIKESKGILTASFEDLKNYYVEAFEILCSVLPVFLGIQNIKLRDNRNKFNDKNKNDFPHINSIIKYKEKVVNKGNKIKFFEEENIFSECFNITTVLNSGIRNSIGHHSYINKNDSQLIIFLDRNKKTELYLIEFSELLLKTFFSTFVGIEVLHFLKNLED
ncbi:hypothetical protein ABEP22_09940 [Bacillus safensis]